MECACVSSRLSSSFLSSTQTHLHSIPFSLLINLHDRASQGRTRPSRLLRPRLPTRAGCLTRRRMIVFVVVEERVTGGAGGGSGVAEELCVVCSEM